jgi:C-terminal processing protease CtpA/Prc
MKRFRCLTVLLFAAFVSLPVVAQDLGMERTRAKNMLKVVSSDIEKNFYDPQLKGLDWKGLTAAAETRINNAKTPGEMHTAIFSLVDKLQDSHTKFSPPAHTNRPLFGFEAKAFGEDIRIYEIKAKSAAAEAGLQVGDRILNINGFDAERNSFDLMMLYYRRLRPAPALKITYQRGSADPQTMMLQAKVKKEAMLLDVHTIENIWRYLIENWELGVDYYMTLDDGTAYIQVSDFPYDDVGVVHKLETPKAVVVDLRGNPGGSERTLLELAGHFEPEQTIMGEKVSRKKTEPLKIKPQKPNFAVPMVILVDSYSASAAEMFARHFQRTGHAVIVGDRSSGRVNASNYFSEQFGAERLTEFGVQISVARVVFPGGEELEHHGVTPDVPCLPTGEDLLARRDPCLSRAFMIAREKAGLPSELPTVLAKRINSFAAGVAADRQKRLDSTKD